MGHRVQVQVLSSEDRSYTGVEENEPSRALHYHGDRTTNRSGQHSSTLIAILNNEHQQEFDVLEPYPMSLLKGSYRMQGFGAIASWGLNPEIVRQLYVGAIKPIRLYMYHP